MAPGTFLRWIREAKKHDRPPARPGRRHTPLQIRRLILKLAHSVTATTIRNLVKEHGLGPGPQRGETTWDEFVRRHAASLWQMDFFSRRVVMLQALREVFALVFLSKPGGALYHRPLPIPRNEWIVAEAESLVNQAREGGLRVNDVVHDRDTEYSRSFDGNRNSGRSKNVSTRCLRFDGFHHSSIISTGIWQLQIPVDPDTSRAVPRLVTRPWAGRRSRRRCGGLLWRFAPWPG